MNARITQADIVRNLAQQLNIQMKDVDGFVRIFFTLLSDSLLRDKLVKIKNLGTFKVVDVAERESVDVNTGERIRIENHAKVVFTPDSELRDRVNKPFAAFQTIILNDKTDVNEMAAVPENTYDNDNDNEDDNEDKMKDDEKNYTEVRHKDGIQWGYIIYLLLTILLMMLSYLAGYYKIMCPCTTEMRERTISCENETTKQSCENPCVSDTTAVATPKADSETSLPAITQDENPKEDADAKAVEKYQQVPGGKYLIVGTKGIHSMKVGDNLYKISRKEYGNTHYVPYIIVHNGFKNPDVIPPGYEIKLPELKEKK